MRSLRRSWSLGWSLQSSRHRHYFWWPDPWKAQFPALLLPSQEPAEDPGSSSLPGIAAGGSAYPQAVPSRCWQRGPAVPRGQGSAAPAPCLPSAKNLDQGWLSRGPDYSWGTLGNVWGHLWCSRHPVGEGWGWGCHSTPTVSRVALNVHSAEGETCCIRYLAKLESDPCSRLDTRANPQGSEGTNQGEPGVSPPSSGHVLHLYKRTNWLGRGGKVQAYGTGSRGTGPG